VVELTIYLLLAYSFLSYSRIIFNYIRSWNSISSLSSLQTEILPIVSVLIAARNEGEYIESTINDLLSQSYPNFEIIVVDDHSNDDTLSKLRSYHNDSLRILQNDGTGKKEALETGLKHAQSDIILFTDADVKLNTEWITSMMKKMIESKADLVCGPVTSTDNASELVQEYYQQEMLGWMVITGGAINSRLHPAANGANLLIKKSWLKEDDPFQKKKSASGDDIFLVKKVLREGSVVFNKSVDALVKTYPPLSLNNLIHQKRRWASKNKWLESAYANRVFFHVALLHIMIALFWFLSFFYTIFLPGLLLAFMGKTFVDFRLIRSGSLWSDQHVSFSKTLLIQLLQIPVTLWVGLSTLFSTKIIWKGRVS